MFFFVAFRLFLSRFYKISLARRRKKISTFLYFLAMYYKIYKVSCVSTSCFILSVSYITRGCVIRVNVCIFSLNNNNNNTNNIAWVALCHSWHIATLGRVRYNRICYIYISSISFTETAPSSSPLAKKRNSLTT